MRKKILTGLVILLTAVGLNVVLESAASADCSPSSIQVETSYDSVYHTVIGRARINGCGNSSKSTTLTIQYGSEWLWHDKAYGSANGSGSWNYVYFFDCVGYGTQTWRTIATGGNVGGQGYVVKSNYLQITC